LRKASGNNEKNPNMVVIIDEIPMENYGIGGKTVRERRKEQQK